MVRLFERGAYPTESGVEFYICICDVVPYNTYFFSLLWCPHNFSKSFCIVSTAVHYFLSVVFDAFVLVPHKRFTNTRFSYYAFSLFIVPVHVCDDRIQKFSVVIIVCFLIIAEFGGDMINMKPPHINRSIHLIFYIVL